MSLLQEWVLQIRIEHYNSTHAGTAISSLRILEYLFSMFLDFALLDDAP
jgi:hypothetical protein